MKNKFVIVIAFLNPTKEKVWQQAQMASDMSAQTCKAGKGGRAEKRGARAQSVPVSKKNHFVVIYDGPFKSVLLDGYGRPMFT